MKNSIFIPVASLFVISGSVCTLGNKWADLLEAPDNEGNYSTFGHPFLQTFLMFLGEWFCMGVFMWTLKRKQDAGEAIVAGVDTALPCNKFIFLLPAACDFTASTMNFVGLTLTHASVYQMLKGATVLFTGVFSVIFLKRKFQLYQYFGMILVVAGLALVGAASMMNPSGDHSAKNPVLGNTLILCAQVIASAQMVIEERIIHKYQVPPFQMVGWEGTFGLGLATASLAIFQAFGGKPDDALLAAEQMSNCWRCSLAVFVVLCGIPVYNATAVTITKGISATARMVLDTIRNVVVWVFSLAYTSFFKETFDWMQLVGFILIVAGTGIYKNFIKLPCDGLAHKEDVGEVPDDRNDYGTIDNDRERLPTEMTDCSEVNERV